jgi:hypothetical protein
MMARRDAEEKVVVELEEEEEESAGICRGEWWKRDGIGEDVSTGV